MSVHPGNIVFKSNPELSGFCSYQWEPSATIWEHNVIGSEVTGPAQVVVLFVCLFFKPSKSVLSGKMHKAKFGQNNENYD